MELKRAGVNHKGLCPFHGEKTPSFTVSPARQTYHCFGCGAHGNALGFLMEQAGLGFMDAVRELAQQAGVPVPEDDDTPEERSRAAEQRQKQASLTEILARAAQHYRAALKASPRAIEYLKRRGLTGEVAARFGLGYAPDGWRNLASAFAEYDNPALAEAGLVIVQGEDAEQKRYDRFRDRIMFPIQSVRGEIIGFGGRMLDPAESETALGDPATAKPAAAQPKYLNSPETPVFIKGRELYGLFEARTAIRQAGFVLVVEGYMDVVALAQSGIANAVATLGTACTPEHIAKLFRFTESVVFSFDGDAAGRKAATRALEASLPYADDTRTIRFLFLPPEHDPDSFVRELGTAAFERAVAEAVPLSAHLMAQASADCDLGNAEGRARMLAQAQPLIEALPEGLLREQLITELAQRGGTDRQALQAHWLRRAGRGRSRPDSQTSAAQAPAQPRRRTSSRPLPTQIATLLDRTAWLLARNPTLWATMPNETHELLAGQAAPYGGYFAALERVLDHHGPLSQSALFEEIDRDTADHGLARLLDRLREFHDVADDAEPAQLVEPMIRQLRIQAVGQELEHLLQAGDLSDASKARRNELIRLQTALRTHSPTGTL